MRLYIVLLLTTERCPFLALAMSSSEPDVKSIIPSFPWHTVNVMLFKDKKKKEKEIVNAAGTPNISFISHIKSTCMRLTFPGWCWWCWSCRHRWPLWLTSRWRVRSAALHHPKNQTQVYIFVHISYIFFFTHLLLLSPSACCPHRQHGGQKCHRWESWRKCLKGDLYRIYYRYY